MARQKPVFNRLASSRQHTSTSSTSLLLATLLVVLVLPPAALLAQSPPLLRYLVLGINAATVLVYRHDKRAAARRDGSRRWSETTLQLWALAGGWPGALMAQRVMRHKARKWGFLAVFWAIVVLEEGWCLRLLGYL